MRTTTVAVLLVILSACGCSTSRHLFNGKDLNGWVEVGSDGAWSVENGILKCSGEKTGYAWLSTEEQYGDFVLELDWRIPEGTNAGVFLRVPTREGRASMLGCEVQIKDDRQDPDLTDVSGSVFRRIPASGKYAKPPGEWNHYRIRFKDRILRIELNGHLVSETDIDSVDPQGDDPPMVGIPDEGYIGLQNHGDPVEFRNIRISGTCPLG
jgi:hypothetical protein